MIKTTVYVDESTDRAIKRLARARGTSQAALIREALRAYAVEARMPRPVGVGAYRSGRSDVSERAEEILLEAAREGRL